MKKEQAVLERDCEESSSVANGHLKVDGTEVDKGRDQNSVLGKEGEDDGMQRLMCETQTDDTTVGNMEMSQVAGEQDSPSCTPDAVIAAGETIQNVYFNGPVLPQSPSLAHKHPQNEIETPGHRRTNSFQRLKTQMHKAWRGVSNLRDDSRPTFNPEGLSKPRKDSGTSSTLQKLWY
ncbi:DENN (AEX-3) domain-containing protein [Raphanus sativus]|nr:DENN (AEX-3) domain-containing protein [Raphanus sativus]